MPLRPYSTATNGNMSLPMNSTTRSRKKWSRTKKAFIFLLPIVGLFSLMKQNGFVSMDNLGHFSRRLAIQCIHNVYVKNFQMAIDMPPLPAQDVVPGYLALCQEWVRSEFDDTYDAGTITEEDDLVCLDWTSPHYSVMEMFASALIDRLHPNSRYRHNCFKKRTWDEAVLGFDRTTVQNMLPIAKVNPLLWSQYNLIKEGDMLEQCKICLAAYDPVIEQDRVRATSFYHCFANPETFGPFVNGSKISGDKWGLFKMGGVNMSVIPYEDPPVHNETKFIHEVMAPAPPNAVPLATVIDQINARLLYLGRIFHDVASQPPKEIRNGCVVYIDISSDPIPPETLVIEGQYAKNGFPHKGFVPQWCSSISVLSGPLCATSTMSNGQRCTDYAEELVDYFKTVSHYNNTYNYTNLGYDEGHGISFQMLTSTAAMWSRMIMCKNLVCLPNSPNCYLPAISKDRGTSAKILETPFDTKGLKWLARMGRHGRASAWMLGSDFWDNSTYTGTGGSEERRLMDTESLTTTWGDSVASIFTHTKEMNDHIRSGYVKPESIQTFMTVDESYNTEPQTIITNVQAQGMVARENNPHIDIDTQKFLEFVPTEEEIQTAIDNELPFNSNYMKHSETAMATDELGLDVDIGLEQDRLTGPKYKAMRIEHSKSEYRIVEETQAAKQRQFNAARGRKWQHDFPPSMEMEVYCPDELNDGRTVSYIGSTVITDNEEGEDITISDGPGTAVFNKTAGLATSTDNLTYNQDGDPYNTVYDSMTGEEITITGKNLTMNLSMGVAERDPIGVLVVNNETKDGTLITEGSTGTFSFHPNLQQSKYEGEIISTGHKRTDQYTPIRYGRGYAVNKAMGPGAKRTVDGPFDGFMKETVESYHDIRNKGYEGKQLEPVVWNNTIKEYVGGEGIDDRSQGDRGLKQVGHQQTPAEVMIKIPHKEFKFGMTARDLKEICLRYADRVAEAWKRHRTFSVDNYDNVPPQQPGQPQLINA